MKRMIALLLCVLLCGCAQTAPAQQAEPMTEVTQTTETTQAVEETAAAETAAYEPLADGVYSAVFDTDSGMFRVNESCEGRGILTVADGSMTIHISLGSKKIVNLFLGMAEDAQKDGAEILQPTLDPVTYSDGYTEEVYGFDVPVPVLGQDFDLALIGTKGKWYDHKVSVSDPQPMTASVEDGSYLAEMTLEGGTGRATVESPCELTVTDGVMTARIVWSSSSYDYMIVNGVRLEPETMEPNSVFLVPVTALDTPISVIADTIAMSTPHEIEYTLTFASASLTAK